MIVFLPVVPQFLFCIEISIYYPCFVGHIIGPHSLGMVAKIASFPDYIVENSGNKALPNLNN